MRPKVQFFLCKSPVLRGRRSNKFSNSAPPSPLKIPGSAPAVDSIFTENGGNYFTMFTQDHVKYLCT